MTIGERIAEARKKKGLTQEYLAWKTNVSVQAVSAWENDRNMPDRDHLIALSGALEVPLEQLTGGRPDPGFVPGTPYFDPERMYTFVKAKAQAAGLPQALAALPLMRGALSGRTLEGSGAPYSVRPLTMACHALAMGIADDDVLAAVLLADAARLGGAPLPVNENVREALRLLSRSQGDGVGTEEAYFAGIAGHPLAALAACIERCCELSTMAGGLSREKMIERVKQAEKYALPLLDAVKQAPAWNDAAWLLRYQTVTALETLMRLL